MNKTIIVKFDKQYSPEIIRIRNAVFTDEQKIDKSIDFDGKDHEAIHVLIKTHNLFVGTGRMLKDGHIGRLAVLKEHRGKGLGAMTVMTLVGQARHLGIKRVYLGAQKHAVSFYKKLNFSEYGASYLEAGIRHIHMEKII